jgi:hypothetical protein
MQIYRALYKITSKISSIIVNRDRVKYMFDQHTWYVGFEVFTEVPRKNAVSWDVVQCGFCKNRRFGGAYRLHYQCDKNRLARNNVSRN